MRVYNRMCVVLLAVFLLMTAAINVYLIKRKNDQTGIYRVEAKTLADDINDTGSYDIADYPHITGVFFDEGDDLYKSNSPYVIIRAGGRLARVEYRQGELDHTIFTVDLFCGVLFVTSVGVLWFIGRNIIKPFTRINGVPVELAKGNLAVPIPEERSRFFGKFTWGVNLLRETIETGRKKELSFQRDKKLLLLSLSHDIKTPLQAIKLNARALARGLYTDEDKRREAAESINARADEIEGFVSRITHAASEDFMSFEVKMGEAFLSQIIGKLRDRYEEQLALTGTQLVIGEYSDCLLSCDPDRLAECLQNLFENAMKYGDGRRISLRFESVDGCILITVENTGCTIEKPELTQIFESFHRGSNADNVQGSGLGLFICRRLMNLMNGEVFADIEGGCFCITLVVRMA